MEQVLTPILSKSEASKRRFLYRKIQRISYKDYVTNEEVCVKIQEAIGPHEDLLSMVKRRTLQWYGFRSLELDVGADEGARFAFLLVARSGS